MVRDVAVSWPMNFYCWRCVARWKSSGARPRRAIIFGGRRYPQTLTPNPAAGSQKLLVAARLLM